MIAQLTGRLVIKAVDHVVVDVHDVGFRIFIPLSTYYDLPEINASVSLLIHTYVREDALQLYGFLTADERDIFEALLRVTKVGPKLALAMLSGMSAGDLQQAVVEGDVPRLSAVPGVGRKTAERIVLELREKLAKGPAAPVGGLGSRDNGQQAVGDAVTALQNLGYPRAVAERTIAQVLRKPDRAAADEVPGLKELVRAALQLLGQEKGA
jgi:holliday junction DNA helicase RuvA